MEPLGNKTSILHPDMLIKNYKYSSSYLILGDSAVVEVGTKLDSNQPTMSSPNPLGEKTEKESSSGFLATSPLASPCDYHFVWKHSFCSQL